MRPPPGEVRRPGGAEPPTSATLPDGRRLDLRPLAVQVTEIHLQRHPEDVERYGALAWEWCVHDTAHMLSWAVDDLDFAGQLRWLAGVLGARGYPVANLRDCVLTCARVVRERAGEQAQGAAQRLELGARELEAFGGKRG